MSLPPSASPHVGRRCSRSRQHLLLYSTTLDQLGSGSHQPTNQPTNQPAWNMGTSTRGHKFPRLGRQLRKARRRRSWNVVP